ncbi:ADP-ribosylglycohydrolase family protein [Hymenobacter rubidus]|uniref:ADP-ribosylglycohydrolase family protein n=1 Tax=Hymenobacter rubidus TaxID=1441626 RepID=UPI00191E6FE6|nr:ADP-ribosylglycohydrolase family protein [Hymenobacter rubidus]
MINDTFEACILGGAIGDAWGSSVENQVVVNDTKTYYLGGKVLTPATWFITDDTQLTLATCEALTEADFNPEILAKKFLEYYKQKKITGIGTSTLKAILDLKAGIHWTLAGRQGAYAAGNGAAMRIAPFAFYSGTTRENILDACRITHRNDDAYVGALAVYLSIKAIINRDWDGRTNLLDLIIPELPDTNVKDRMIEINNYPKNTTISDIAKLGNNGYVVNSVPFAIFSATKILELGLTKLLRSIIDTHGDTDTNASIAGQISGALIGMSGIPNQLVEKLKFLPDYLWIKSTIDKANTSIH